MEIPITYTMNTIGWIDKIDIPDFDLQNVPAKIDTGANRSAIHCSDIRVQTVDGTEKLCFKIPIESNQENPTFYSEMFFKKKIKSSSGHVEERYIVKVSIIAFGKKYKTTFSLTDRTDMKYPILLGRKLLKNRFIVDVSQSFLSYNSKTK